MSKTLLSDPSPSTAVSLNRRRDRRWPRILLITGGSLLLLLLVAASAGLLWLRSAAKAALPQLDGDLHLAGLSAPVTIRRDAHGVPHIDAATQDDLFLAQGYVTAQDRLWQMDSLRRGANGELAEILGSRLVEYDKTQRVLQIRRTAQRVYSNLPAAERRRLDDYARGVNLYIAQCQAANTLPVEFHLLHYQPQPWRGQDSLSVGMMLVQTLDSNIATKISRAHISARLNDPQLESDLYPVGSWRDHPPTGIRLDLTQPQPLPPPASDEDDDNTETRALPTAAPSASALVADFKRQGSRVDGNARLLQSLVSGHEFTRADRAAKSTGASAPDSVPENPSVLEALGRPACPGCTPGSNNWVVSGAHTASGRPLLSNDMHLALRAPDNWYIADLRAPGYHAAGVTLPGFPYVIAGHNDHVAWGFTALYSDVQDLYIEKLDGKGNYEGIDAQWHLLAIDRETIHVRGGKDIQLDVQSTAHGPLLNPILAASDPPTALKWTLYDPALNALPIYELNTASNWSEFSAALATWCWPTQNLVYSDDQGHIAYHAIGKIPIRQVQMSVYDVPLPHDVLNMRLEWFGSPSVSPFQLYIPFDQLPNAFDPPSGFLATANSRVTADQSPFKLTDDWADPYRIQRIYKSLDGRNGLTPADLLAVQTDIYSEVDQEFAHRFAYAIDHTPGPQGNADPRLRQAADLMRSWDGRLTADSPAASLVTTTRVALRSLILEPKLGNLAAEYHWGETNFAEEEIVMHAKPEWLPMVYKNWDALLTAAVRKGMKDGHAPYDLNQWTYGSWHAVEVDHPLSVFLPWIGRIANAGPLPQTGDTTTVKQVGRSFGPSQRFTMDWSNIDGSTENIVLGESGNPLSPYYKDQWNNWYGGTTFALPFTPQAVAAQTAHTLRLVP